LIAVIAVHVELHGLLRLLSENLEEEGTMTVPEGSDVGSILKMMHAEDQIWLVAVNGRVVRWTHTLSEGDRIDCYPPMAGG